ncbi:major facilitator superfamily domain-containing protein [Bombardia bombarda]|uniref:Major facilitator superfamily domain-containing protein n=1 Tax=Bombardia bombarda TaxID=252184 RepID=A0AA40C1X7_9PEZI|nr:major facilitator superfamily domain-containing protein [Bombardia bombarda]
MRSCRSLPINDGLSQPLTIIWQDETIITTAIPQITDDFKSINDIGWYGSAYFMTFASFQLIYGKLYTCFSIKNVFLSSIAIFEAGSLICATAPNSPAFITGRAIAGLGSAGINAGFIIILAASLPLHRRPLFVSSYSGMYGVAAVAAPLLGGVFTTKATWRWCFYINLPIGGAAVLAMALFFHPPARNPLSPTTLTFRETISQMDLPGTAVLVPGIVCLILALQWGGAVYDWSDFRVLVPLVAAGVLLGLVFVGIQVWRGDYATVPPRIISQRSVACSTVYVFCAGGALNVLQYFLPLYFQALASLSPLASGYHILPTTLSTVLFSLVAGYGVAKTGYYTPFMIAGSLLLVLSTALIATAWSSTSSAASSLDPAKWITHQLLFGAGAGLGIQQAHTAAQTVLSDADVPTGAVVLIFAQILGGTVWVSVAQNVLAGRLLRGLLDIPGIMTIPGLLDGRGRLLDVGATGLRGLVEAAGGDVGKVLEAYGSSWRGSVLVAVGLATGAAVAGGGMEWRSIKEKGKNVVLEGSVDEGADGEEKGGEEKGVQELMGGNEKDVKVR